MCAALSIRPKVRSMPAMAGASWPLDTGTHTDTYTCTGTTARFARTDITQSDMP